MSLRLLLALAGGLEILAGSAALIIPAPVVSLRFGVSMDPVASVLARLFGAGVFALGLACLKARHDVASPAGLAVSLGITAYNVLAAVVLLWTAAGSSLGGFVIVGRGDRPCHTGRVVRVVTREVETVRED